MGKSFDLGVQVQDSLDRDAAIADCFNVGLGIWQEGLIRLGIRHRKDSSECPSEF